MARGRVHGGSVYRVTKVGTDLHWDIGRLGVWVCHWMCDFDVFDVDMNTPSYKEIHPTCILYEHEWPQKGKYIED